MVISKSWDEIEADWKEHFKAYAAHPKVRWLERSTYVQLVQARLNTADAAGNAEWSYTCTLHDIMSRVWEPPLYNPPESDASRSVLCWYGAAGMRLFKVVYDFAMPKGQRITIVSASDAEVVQDVWSALDAFFAVPKVTWLDRTTFMKLAEARLDTKDAAGEFDWLYPCSLEDIMSRVPERHLYTPPDEDFPGPVLCWYGAAGNKLFRLLYDFSMEEGQNVMVSSLENIFVRKTIQSALDGFFAFPRVRWVSRATYRRLQDNPAEGNAPEELSEWLYPCTHAQLVSRLQSPYSQSAFEEESAKEVVYWYGVAGTQPFALAHHYSYPSGQRTILTSSDTPEARKVIRKALDVFFVHKRE